MAVLNDLVLYQYDFSPFSRRVAWYLALRQIPHAECAQPMMMPRPDLQAIGVEYRRIPILAHGKSVFCDSRLIVSYLEKAFPSSNLAAESPDQEAVQKLLESWIIDGGIFNRAAQTFPPDAPMLKDPKFVKDREQYMGRSWSQDAAKELRPEGLIHLRNAFEFLETVLLADGRDWMLKTSRPKLADLEVAWLVSWTIDLKFLLPENIFSAQVFPKLYAWVARFRKEVEQAKESLKQAGHSPNIGGDEATNFIKNAKPVSGRHTTNGRIDSLDPTALREGSLVESWPSDTGTQHRDRGRLVGLDHTEVVLVNDLGVHIHHPRWNFKVQAVEDKGKVAPKI